MIQRLLLALVISAGITLGLFYLMQSLIKAGSGVEAEPTKGAVLDFVRLKKEETVKKKERKPKKPPKPEEPPPPMEQPQMTSQSPDAGDAGFDFSADVSTDVALEGGLALDSGDGDYMPIMRVDAVYPRRALSRGIEGWVIVEFTVTKLGTVKGPKVLDAQPADLFNRSALDAVLKYKYKPRMVNGEPVDVHGVTNKVTFKLAG